MKPKGDLPLSELTSSDQEHGRKDQLKMDKRIIVVVVISLAVVLILGLGIGLGVNWSNDGKNDGRICEYFYAVFFLMLLACHKKSYIYLICVEFSKYYVIFIYFQAAVSALLAVSVL